jgi:hypothetical protein
VNAQGRDLILILTEVAVGIAIVIVSAILLPVPCWFIGGETLKLAGIPLDLFNSPGSVSLGAIITILIYAVFNFFFSLLFAIANQRYLAVTIIFGTSVSVFFVYDMLQNITWSGP